MEFELSLEGLRCAKTGVGKDKEPGAGKAACRWKAGSG
jgi:hypothetical protein